MAAITTMQHSIPYSGRVGSPKPSAGSDDPVEHRNGIQHLANVHQQNILVFFARVSRLECQLTVLLVHVGSSAGVGTVISSGHPPFHCPPPLDSLSALSVNDWSFKEAPVEFSHPGWILNSTVFFSCFDRRASSTLRTPLDCQKGL